MMNALDSPQSCYHFTSEISVVLLLRFGWRLLSANHPPFSTSREKSDSLFPIPCFLFNTSDLLY
ncbi:MAG: hypothetical protein F6K56_34390 [Moorea sp. SIO3G5]|nr:hypothetical protein [Moorena sp. SIO3G5]